AFVLSLTWVPMMSALLLRKEHKPNFADRFSDRLSLFFRQRLLQVLRMPRRSIATVAVLALGAGLLAARLGGEFIPALEEGDFAVETRLLTGSNLQATT
ncbi:MAG: efflux RND transporter permease subunit, partial [Bacteroidia bacterium]